MCDVSEFNNRTEDRPSNVLYDQKLSLVGLSALNASLWANTRSQIHLVEIELQEPEKVEKEEPAKEETEPKSTVKHGSRQSMS